MVDYFVVVHAHDQAEIRRLESFGVDVFHSTASRSKGRDGFDASIDGLLSFAEIAKLVDAGYRITIEDPKDRRAPRVKKALGLKQWLQEMEPILARQRTVG